MGETEVDETGPRIACEGCGNLVSLALARAAGDERILTCPTCRRVKRWGLGDDHPTP